MLLFWLAMLPSMLASESRMVVYVAVCTVYLRVLGVLLVNLEDMLDPLDVESTGCRRSAALERVDLS